MSEETFDHATFPPEHKLRWKGKIAGPYTRDHIEQLLARGEISLLHSVEDNGVWKGLDEFLTLRPRPFAPVFGHEGNATNATNAVSPDDVSPARLPRLATPHGANTGESSPHADSEFDAVAAFANIPSAASPASAVSAGDEPPPIHFRFDPVKTGYILCGVSFILPFFATIPALAIALWLHSQPAPAAAHSKPILRAAIVLSILGSLFWLAVKYLL